MQRAQGAHRRYSGSAKRLDNEEEDFGLYGLDSCPEWAALVCKLLCNTNTLTLGGLEQGFGLTSCCDSRLQTTTVERKSSRLACERY